VENPLGPRPRSLPVVPTAAPAKRSLPLADAARPVDQSMRPNYAVWEITLACDLACRHCGSRAGKERPDELSTAECLDLVEQMAALGVREVTVIGGEAYLREDWLDIVRHIRRHGMLCSMTTGGRGLTLERAMGAKEAGLQSVSVSVDGLQGYHDLLRGVAGSFESAIQAMDHVQQAGMRLSCNTQINRPNIHEIPATFDLLVAHGMKHWQVQLTTAMGRGGDQVEMLLEPFQMLEVLPMLAKLKPKADEKGVMIWPGNNIGYFGTHEYDLRGHFRSGHRGRCGAGRSTLGIEANGNIKGCPSLPTTDYVGGNVRENSLRDIWEKAGALRFTRDETPKDLKGFCKTCYYAEECMGGCNWTAHVLLGFRGDNPYCHHRAIELFSRGVRERIRKKTAAPGEPFDYAVYEYVEEPWPEADRLVAEQLLAKGAEYTVGFARPEPLPSLV
jgi:radical SAM protein with 4Fe4S-binding SPASM domain